LRAPRHRPAFTAQGDVKQFAERLGTKASPLDSEHCGYSTTPSHSAKRIEKHGTGAGRFPIPNSRFKKEDFQFEKENSKSEFRQKNSKRQIPEAETRDRISGLVSRISCPVFRVPKLKLDGGKHESSKTSFSYVARGRSVVRGLHHPGVG
jgi:hypothetical protein